MGEEIFEPDLSDIVTEDDTPVDKIKNPLLDIAGFAEIGKMDSKDIDKEIYKL